MGDTIDGSGHRHSVWGTRRPGLLFRALLLATRAVPQLPVVKQLAFLLRRVARTVVEDPVDVVHWGHRLRLFTRGNISESTFLFMPARWDRPERELLERELRPGAVFVDVGANAGGYIWWVLRCLGEECRALAIEADPALCERLAFNLATNGWGNVEVVGTAVGVEPGEGWLKLDPGNRGQNVLADHPGDRPDPEEDRGLADGRVIRVPVRRLHEIVTESGLPRIDALKIDVEGLEAAVLRDFFHRAPPSLWPGLLLVERQGPDHGALDARLTALGYEEALATRLNVVLRRPR
jgi:FkbM family methyltransferase